MISSYRQKRTLISLLIYWPLLFILTHIPLRQDFLRQLQASDKTLHFLVYFILSFLLYFAAFPSEKLRLRCRKFWLLLLALLFYAAADEWLQGLVGRSCDFLDFLANLAGIAAAFVLLSLFSFWPALLIFTGISIIIITKAAQLRFTGSLAFIRPALYFLAYGFFSSVWYHFICSLQLIKNSSVKRLAAALALPILLLVAAAIFSFALGNSFKLPEIILSLAAIFAAVTIFYFSKRTV